MNSCYLCTFSVCRVHAEFQLNQFPNYPFWFTPGQFVGRLIIRKDCNHLEFFELGISTANSLNIGNKSIESLVCVCV